MDAAVKPVTEVTMPYSSSQAGAIARRSSTSRAVAGSSGPVSGMIWTRAVSAFWLGTASATSRTPGIRSTSARIPARIPRGSVDSTIVPVMTSGPL